MNGLSAKLLHDALRAALRGERVTIMTRTHERAAEIRLQLARAAAEVNADETLITVSVVSDRR